MINNNKQVIQIEIHPQNTVIERGKLGNKTITMNQEVIIDSIKNHLDSIETYVDWVILLAVAIAWAGIRRETEIEVLGAKFNRRHAFFAVAALYLIANVAFLILALRIGDLIALLDREHAVEGITTLATHAWVLNPFGYFGKSGIARLHAGEGFGLLIATWWLCNGSLYHLWMKRKIDLLQFFWIYF